MIDLKKYYAQKYKKKKTKAIKTLQSYKGKETSIEKKVRQFLTEEGLFFIQEYGINYVKKKKKFYKVYDFYVSGINEKGNKYDFLIENDGNYWHGTDYLEGKIPYSKLTKIQKSNIKNDKLKNKIAKDLGLPLLRLKEKDIKSNFNYVKEQIYKYINLF